MFNQEENDDEDYDFNFELSEVEEWYENNYSYFLQKKENEYGPSLEVENFYNAVYVPFMRDLKKPIKQLVDKQFPFIAQEHRPQVLAQINADIDWIGHEFILFLYNAVSFLKTEKDIHEIYPDFDEWAKTTANYRKPHYIDASIFIRTEGITEEIIQEVIAESIIESDLQFEFEDKPRSEFYNIVQNIVFKYYPDLFDMNKDGWMLFEFFLYGEYMSYQLNFEHYDSFIEYGLDVEDLDLPYEEYRKKLSIKFNEKFDKEQELIKKQEDSNTENNQKTTS